MAAVARTLVSAASRLVSRLLTLWKAHQDTVQNRDPKEAF